MFKRQRITIAIECALLIAGLFALTRINGGDTSIWIRSGGAVRMDTPQHAAPLVVIDAGHGGMDGGAVGKGGIVEAPLNLAVAKLVQSGLQDRGYRVIMTRSDENALSRDKWADMQARRKIMRTEDVLAVVSIHMNKFRDSAVNGPRAFYMKGSSRGGLLATLILDAVCEEIGYARRLVATENYFVLRESKCPAAIIECGFLSNWADVKKLKNSAYQQKLANGIVAGVVVYFASLPVQGGEGETEEAQ